MFDDVKQQWRDALTPGFDYVLIDSRTGHTDVGGICTRQLPNAVVLMFFPNRQNITGLSTLVEEIRQHERRLDAKISLLYCPSNVPDLDDEDEILRRQLDAAQEAFGYSRATCVIHHYNSLDLLDQAIFVSQRPRTKLAEEYRTLTKAIIKGNLEDREGAIGALEEIRTKLRGFRKVSGARYQLGSPHSVLAQMSVEVDRIQQFHPKDGEVAWGLAAVFSEMGNLQSELDALTIAINERYQHIRGLRIRASKLLAQGNRAGALEDLRQVLASSEATALDVSAAIELLRIIDPCWIDVVEKSPAIRQLDAKDRVQVAELLAVNRRGAELAARIISDPAEISLCNVSDDHRSILVLSLIGARHFEKAIKALKVSRSELLASHNIQDTFNYAMAEWGLAEKVPYDLLQHIVKLDRNSDVSRGANYHQCLALTFAVLGDAAAAQKRTQRSREELGPGSVFSCWRYLRVSQHEMLRDLEEIDNSAKAGFVRPAFLED